MRERLAAKAANRGGANSGSRSRSGPLLSFLPAPKVLFGKRPLSWYIWILLAVLCLAALLLGGAAAAVFLVASVVHLLYVLNFSRTDLAVQMRLAHLVAAILGYFVPVIRTVMYVALFVLIVADVAVDYSIVERALYCMPANRPDNPEEVTLDFVTRVFSAPPPKPGKPFAVAPGVQPGIGSD